MKNLICMIALLGCVVVCFGQTKKPLDLKFHEPDPYKDFHARPAHPQGGVNFGVKKETTLYENGNFRIKGQAEADRSFTGPADGNWRAKAGGRAEYDWRG